MRTERARLRVIHLGARGDVLAVREGFDQWRVILGDALAIGTKALVISLRRPTSIRLSSAVAARLARALDPLGIRLHDVLIRDGADVTSLRALRVL